MYPHPLPLHPHLRGVDRRAVEIIGGDPSLGNRHQTGILLLCGQGHGTQVNQLGHDFIHDFMAGGRHSNVGGRGALALGTQVKVEHLEATAALHHQIQSPADQARVQQVAGHGHGARQQPFPSGFGVQGLGHAQGEAFGCSPRF